MKKKVLVIGSNSFSGSDFIDLLLEEQKYAVLGVSRSAEKSPLFLPYKRHTNAAFEFYPIDLNRDLGKLAELLDATKPDYVVNFAAQSEVGPSWANPGHWFQTNAVAVTELANMLKDRKWIQRYVHISSPEVYGTCEGTVLESAPLNPSTPYAASKAAGDMSLFTFVQNCGLPMTMIRATNVYGAHQQLFKIIPRSIIYLKLGKTIGLDGGGVAVKSYIHIRDVSRGELAAMESGRTGEIYHFSPDRGVAVRDVVQQICTTMGKDFAASTTIAPERLGQDKAYVIDSTKARKEFGWAPNISLAQGIGQVTQWVNDNFTAIQAEPLQYQHKV